MHIMSLLRSVSSKSTYNFFFFFLRRKSTYKYAPPHADWPPVLSARHKCDLAQAEYDEKEILDLSTNWAVLCANCLQWGHPKITCPARVICINCSTPGHNAIDCPLHTNTNPKISCVVKSGSNIGNPINSAGFIASADQSHNAKRKSSVTIRCSACGFYGHVEQSLYEARRERCWRCILFPRGPKFLYTIRILPQFLHSLRLSLPSQIPP